MQCALLIYNPDDDVADQAQRPIDPGIAAVLAGTGLVTERLRVHEISDGKGQRLLPGAGERA